MELVVSAVTAASDRSVLVELRSADGAALPGYVAGSHVDLGLGSDRGLRRSYSLLGAGDAAPTRYEVCIQRAAVAGPASASNWVNDHLAVGDVLPAWPPLDTFRFPAEPSRAVLIAGGIGITPLLSIARRLQADGVPFELVDWGQQAEHLPLAGLLSTSPFAGSVTLLGTDRDGSPRVAPAPTQLRGASPTGAVGICGPEGFIATMTAHALASGWDADRIIVERFDAAESDSPAADTAFEVVASSDGRAFEVAPGASILEVLTAAGYEIDSSCRRGTCGTCLTEVLEGTPDHRDVAQSDAEHASNELIAVCCSRSLTPRLVLDV